MTEAFATGGPGVGVGEGVLVAVGVVCTPPVTLQVKFLPEESDGVRTHLRPCGSAVCVESGISVPSPMKLQSPPSRKLNRLWPASLGPPQPLCKLAQEGLDRRTSTVAPEEEMFVIELQSPTTQYPLSEGGAVGAEQFEIAWTWPPCIGDAAVSSQKKPNSDMLSTYCPL